MPWFFCRHVQHKLLRPWCNGAWCCESPPIPSMCLLVLMAELQPLSYLLTSVLCRTALEKNRSQLPALYYSDAYSLISLCELLLIAPRQLNSNPPALSNGQLAPGVEVTGQVHITNRPELLESPPHFISPDGRCEHRCDVFEPPSKGDQMGKLRASNT